MTAINFTLPDGAKPRKVKARTAAPAAAPVPTPAPRVFEPLEGLPATPVGNLASFNVVVAAPSAPVAPKSEYEVLDEFARAIQDAGMVAPIDLVADGKLHRFNPDGKGKDRSGSGWYVLHLDGVPAGIFGDWSTGEGSQKWRAKGESQMTRAEREQCRATIRAMQAARHAETLQRQQDAAGLALRHWQAATPARVDHPYLVRKGVQPYGIRAAGSALLVPMRCTAGKLHGLQTIFTDGTKRFTSGGKKQGCYHAIGKPDGVLIVCEGYATGASIHAATGQAVAVAFDATNLLPVAKALQAKYPALALVFGADDDWQAPMVNTGQAKAQEAALATGATVVMPYFPPGRPPKATDFNDLHQLAGLAAVRACFADVVEVATC